MLYSFFIFLLACIFSAWLLDYENVFIMFGKERRAVLISGAIYMVPKLFLLLPLDYSYIVELAWAISILTDVIDYSVFSIVTKILCAEVIIKSIYFCDYIFLCYGLLRIAGAFAVYLMLTNIVSWCFKKEGLGVGDLYFYSALCFYYDAFFLILSFFISSIIGLCFILCDSIYHYKKPMRQIIPFIPCIYLSIIILQNKLIYQFFVNVLL
jgi:hypothetical protein